MTGHTPFSALRNNITRPFAHRPPATPRLRRRPMWERALRPLARALQRLSIWLWHRDARRAVERRAALNTPWPSFRPMSEKAQGRAGTVDLHKRFGHITEECRKELGVEPAPPRPIPGSGEGMDNYLRTVKAQKAGTT